ncbi:MAG: hypothetical protein AB198_02805, partial [Parcubacteria bacterium C7867-003]
MKKIKLLLTILGLTFTSVVSASDISYSIINSTSTTTNSFSFSVNTILKRIIYDCDLTTYDCKQTKEQINQRLEDPIKLVTLDFLNEKEKNKATTTPTTTTVSVSKKEDLVFGNQLIPKDARFLTYSSDGKKLAYFKNDSSMIKSYKNYVLVFDDGKTLEKFEASGDWDLVTDAYRMFGFTGDSKKLVYVDDRDGSNRLYLVDFESKNQNLTGTPLITKNYTVLDFIVNGDNVYFIANRDGAYNWGLYELNLTTKKLSTIGKSVMYTNSLAIVGDNLIFTENSNGSGIIKSYFFNDKKVKSFTGILEDKLDTLPYKIVNTPNIKGVLYSPQKTVSTKKAVIWLHGGPYRQTDINRHSYGSYATFDWMLDEMVRSGAYVLKLDYPGSMGYGVKYTTSIVGRIGDVDIKNVSQSIDYLKNLGIKEVYLFGNSYGGYLSAKASVDLSSKIAGAIAVAPVTDWEKLIRD